MCPAQSVATKPAPGETGEVERAAHREVRDACRDERGGVSLHPRRDARPSLGARVRYAPVVPQRAGAAVSSLAAWTSLPEDERDELVDHA